MLRLFKKKENKEVSGTLAIGIGGGGCNIVNRLGRISAVDIITVNTDKKGLVRSRSNRRILLGGGSIEAGCGGDVALGASLAKDASEEIGEIVGRYMNTVLFVGLGGGTGTGSAGMIAETAKRGGARVTVMASIPMSFESGRRKVATDAIPAIKEKCDILVLTDCDRLAELDPMIGAREAFSVLDQMMCESFMSLMEMLEGEEGEQVFREMKGKTYTVSFAEGMRVSKVSETLVSGLMLESPVTSRPIVFIRGNIPQDGSQRALSERISESTGREPMFVQGPGGHGMNLMMFAPVQ